LEQEASEGRFKPWNLEPMWLTKGSRVKWKIIEGMLSELPATALADENREQILTWANQGCVSATFDVQHTSKNIQDHTKVPRDPEVKRVYLEMVKH